MMHIDTHGHVNFNAFKQDSDAVLKRALESNTWVIMPGTQFSTSKRAVQMAGNYPKGVYAAVGLHPIHLEEREVDVLEVQSERVQKEPWMVFETRGEEFTYAAYQELIAKAPAKKVVAIGEVGLDYYYEPKGKEKREAFRMKQKTTLALQMKLAEEFNLPVILHCRKAHDDLLEFLHGRIARGVVHCYTGTLAQAKIFYDLGLYFGFNGLIFKKVSALPDPQDIIKNIPLERILLETDSPYLVPPQAREERNEPAYVKYVAEEIARIKGISPKEVADATARNARAVFGIQD
ncbi:MAG: TatD family hydrolase [Candidatus Wildermuthbacteria bacterium]|nr:TatD family hydrolase [Candidatus Wildermuthbacteria bacterium]